MNRKQTLAIFFAAVLFVPAAGTATIGLAQAQTTSGAATPGPIGEPDVTVFAPDNELTPGQPTALTLQVQNNAQIIRGGANPSTVQQVTTARGVEVNLTSDNDQIDITTATQPIGTLPDGAIRPLTFEVVADENIEPGTYDLEAEVDYEYTRTVTDEGLYSPRSESKTIDVTVRVTDDARFEIVEVTDSVAVGETGDVALTVRNIGGEPASEASVTVQSGSADIVFGQSPSATRYLGEVEPDDERTISVEATATSGASASAYPLTATVNFENTDGVTSQSVPLQFGIQLGAEQSVSIEDGTSSLAVGDRGTVTATLTNEGPRTLRDATVALQPNGQTVVPVEPEQAIGTLEPGESTTFEYPVRISPEASEGPRQLAFVTAYRDGEGETRQTTPSYLTLDVAERQSFDIAEVTDDLAVGGQGTVNFTVTNEGPFTVEDATVALQPNGETVVPVEPDQPLGTLAPGESTTVQYPVRATAAAEPGPRQLSFVFDYQYDGTAGRSEPEFARVELADEQSFSLSNVNSTLRVGAEGEVEFTLTNDGPNAVSDAVVALQPAGPNVQPQETEYAVGDLAAGEEATVTFPVDVTSSAAAIAKQLSVTVEYRNADDDARQSGPVSTQVEVAPEQRVFALEGVSTQLEAGSEGTVELQLTNNRDEEVRNINAQLFVDSPLSASTDEAYVPSLASGDSTTIAFDLSVAGDAPARNQPVELDFQYDESDGDTKLTDTYQLPIDVTASSDGGGLGLGTIAIGLLAIAGVGLGIFYVRR
ncbi:hypothetical protein N0B31_11465 [Salinirubellus salinus]|uniref:Uncharacterized protein n=1 Tax=Salinirubellus salinus TaxID=1364945 RepID=A0A9E7U321_9EURY|nr:CARDB domain-containing protein [Salinirubellus salinus]UWM52770.1 hypothetical protein N0B31_11465 [Salinirubellus salinus]